MFNQANHEQYYNTSPWMYMMPMQPDYHCSVSNGTHNILINYFNVYNNCQFINYPYECGNCDATTTEVAKVSTKKKKKKSGYRKQTAKGKYQIFQYT